MSDGQCWPLQFLMPGVGPAVERNKNSVTHGVQESELNILFVTNNVLSDFAQLELTQSHILHIEIIKIQFLDPR